MLCSQQCVTGVPRRTGAPSNTSFKFPPVLQSLRRAMQLEPLRGTQLNRLGESTKVPPTPAFLTPVFLH
jgi:hypothetical protein